MRAWRRRAIGRTLRTSIFLSGRWAEHVCWKCWKRDFPPVEERRHMPCDRSRPMRRRSHTNRALRWFAGDVHATVGEDGEAVSHAQTTKNDEADAADEDAAADEPAGGALQPRPPGYHQVHRLHLRRRPSHGMNTKEPLKLCSRKLYASSGRRSGQRVRKLPAEVPGTAWRFVGCRRAAAPLTTHGVSKRLTALT
jgi:hypothetical protein